MFANPCSLLERHRQTRKRSLRTGTHGAPNPAQGDIFRMKRLFFSVSLALFTAFCLVIATAKPAYGYVDPGSGFLAVQTIASVAAAFGYFLRRRIRSLFSKKDEAILVPANLHKSDSTTAE
jgi:hypothetical protein